MKERPILFSASMVRALLDGSKKQTRRVVKPQFAADAIPVEMPATDPAGGWVVPGHSGVWWCDAAANPDDVRRCPYGQPGDRLWVREAHYLTDDGDTEYAVYAADDLATYQHLRSIDALPSDFPADVKAQHRRLRPSIHMPRWASRITLEITSVRVERLQDISEADALAEGIVRQPDGGYGLADTTHYHFTDPRQSYFSLWEAINGAGSVEANPWAWAVSFRRLP